MNILVTGGAGFIGSHMAKRHLADGHRVVVVDDLSSGRRERLPPSARFVQADIAETDLEPLLREERIAFVSHHAAQIDLRHSVSDPIGDARANIIGSLRLAEACRRAGVRRVLFASTGGALYGEPEGGRPATEEHATNPVSPYGCAKLSIEKYLHYYRVRSTASRPRCSVTPTCTVRGRTEPARREWWRSSPKRSSRARRPRFGETAGRPATTCSWRISSTPRRARSSREAAGPGTWAPGSRLRSTASSSFWLASSDTPQQPEHVALPPGEQRRSVLDGTLAQREFRLRGYTPLDQGSARDRPLLSRAPRGGSRLGRRRGDLTTPWPRRSPPWSVDPRPAQNPRGA